MRKATKIGFIAVFCAAVGLTFPVFNIFSKQLSMDSHENRLMTGLPQVLQSPLSQLPRSLDNFFVDNSPFRYQFVLLNAGIDYAVFGTSQSDQVLPGKDGWLFYKDGPTAAQPVANYQGLTDINDSPEVLAQASAKLQILNDRLAENGCTLVLDLTPSKDRIYREYMPDGYPIVNEENRTDLLAGYLQSHTTVPVNWPYQELRRLARLNPDRLLYYKTDTHWNSIGALYGLDGIFDALGLPILQPGDYPVEPAGTTTGDMANVAALYASLPPEQTYTVPGYADLFAKDDRVVRVIGDSFSEYYMPYLEARFATTWREHIDSFDPTVVEQPGCDILILEFNERSLISCWRFWTVFEVVEYRKGSLTEGAFPITDRFTLSVPRPDRPKYPSGYPVPGRLRGGYARGSCRGPGR